MAFSSQAPFIRVAVTAAGVVSPLGCGLGETLDALRSGRDGVGPVRLFDASGCRSQTAGQVDESRLTPWLEAEGRGHGRRRRPRLSPPSHRSSRMLLAAAREALEADPGFQPESLVIGTTSGGMSFGEAFYRSLLAPEPCKEKRRRPGWLAHYPPQKAVADLLDALALYVPCQIIANACASGANAIGHGYDLIRNGLRTAVLAGGYDAISELVFAGFDSLQASTPDQCRPFDRARSGLVLGEGAAVLLLESLESARRRGAPILGEVSGYGLSTDNHHLTQPHPSGIGPLRAMERALDAAGLLPAQIDYINAHGTATPFNDATEGAAIEQLFGKKGVPVSSTKALMGHSLGAAGAVEAAFSLLALQYDFLPPNAHYREADPQWELDIVANTPRFGPVRRVLSNSFGFGGANAALVLQKPGLEGAAS
jgi:3-oxoacyl-[acyl-carrier-protein] synthase II